LFFNNAFYARLGGITTSEMNILELEFLQLIGFTLKVSPEVFNTYYIELRSYISAEDSLSMALPPFYNDSCVTSDNSLLRKNTPDSVSVLFSSNPNSSVEKVVFPHFRSYGSNASNYPQVNAASMSHPCFQNPATSNGYVPPGAVNPLLVTFNNGCYSGPIATANPYSSCPTHEQQWLYLNSFTGQPNNSSGHSHFMGHHPSAHESGVMVNQSGFPVDSSDGLNLVLIDDGYGHLVPCATNSAANSTVMPNVTDVHEKIRSHAYSGRPMNNVAYSNANPHPPIPAGTFVHNGILISESLQSPHVFASVSDMPYHPYTHGVSPVYSTTGSNVVYSDHSGAQSWVPFHMIDGSLSELDQCRQQINVATALAPMRSNPTMSDRSFVVTSTGMYGGVEASERYSKERQLSHTSNANASKAPAETSNVAADVRYANNAISHQPVARKLPFNQAVSGQYHNLLLQASGLSSTSALMLKSM
jgi:hypothetical protein